jgi:hypothetical protein
MLDINAHRWMLRPEKAGAYIKVYNSLREEGSRSLVPSTTRRQFATARDILDRLNTEQQGVLLADDVGLGKTAVAVLCALVFAGSGKRVRILAPNEMMSRRWRQELEMHIKAVAEFAGHLDLTRAQRRLFFDVLRLNPGAIAVSTHQKAGHLACDLLIIDEAHRTRSEGSALARHIRTQWKHIGRLLVLTATPFSIDPNDLARLLVRIGGRSTVRPVRKYTRMLVDLWRGRSSGAPDELARQLVDAARSAVNAIRPYVIRRGIDDLSAVEQRAFGKVEESEGAKPLLVPDDLLEAMLRTDRALDLGRRFGAWSMKRRNDPRYHVAAGKLKSDLERLVKKASSRRNETAQMTRYHGRVAQRRIRAYLGLRGRHPKIAYTLDLARTVVEQGEKVLIFCDHHLPAVEIATALADELRWSGSKQRLSKRQWRFAWSSILRDLREQAGGNEGRDRSVARLNHYLEWLMSEGVRSQVERWLGADVRSISRPEQLVHLLRTKRARGHDACDSIGNHVRQLYKQLVDRESGSTRAILLRDPVTAPLPGATNARVAAVCEPDSDLVFRRYVGVFYSWQPDATLAIFNSPFGPDVLVATDRLSEGVDLHRFCRHLIHHELDPSPVRTVQRNGRLRRVSSWASRTRQPIRVFYPSLRGTRDEKLVEIMRYRLSQFDLLLGGVRQEIDPDQSEGKLTTAEEILNYARARLRRIRLVSA